MKKIEYGSIIFASNVADMYEAIRRKYIVVAMVEDVNIASNTFTTILFPACL